jgi:hypothetical protein
MLLETLTNGKTITVPIGVDDNIQVLRNRLTSIGNQVKRRGSLKIATRTAVSSDGKSVLVWLV